MVYSGSVGVLWCCCSLVSCTVIMSGFSLFAKCCSSVSLFWMPLMLICMIFSCLLCGDCGWIEVWFAGGVG